jgi:hypothetical protein
MTPVAASAHRRQPDAVRRRRRQEGNLVLEPRLRPLLTKLMPRPPGRKVKMASGCAAAICAISAEESWVLSAGQSSLTGGLS